MQVIHLLLEGKSNKQIALQLGVSTRAVEQHPTHIYEKLGVCSRAEVPSFIIPAKTKAPKEKHKSSTVLLHALLLIGVLTRRQPYRGFTHERIAYKYLMRLGIGHDLTRIAINPKYPRRLASEAELLALHPELNQVE